MLHLHKGPLGYTDLMNLLEITNTGKINYHLRILGDLIEKGGGGKYRLTEKGLLASQLLQKFPNKTMGIKPLGVGDAILIGTAGFLLLLPALFFPILIFFLFVSGAAMWWLTVRRTKSHDFYILFKPPLFSLAFVIALIILTLLLDLPHAPFTPLVFFLFLGVGFSSFVGVIIAEAVSRLMNQ